MSPAPPATNSSCNPAHANRLWPAGGTFSARGSKVRRSSDHDRVNCTLGTHTVDAFQLLQRLLSRLLVSYRPLANIEERRQPISPQPYVGRKIMMIQQVASSARQTLAAAKATSLQRCLRTQLRAGSHCLNPRARSPRRLLPLIGATTNDASMTANHLPAPAAARAASERLWRAAAAQDLKADNTCDRQGAARDKRWSCFSTDATDAPNRQARRRTHKCTSNTRAIDGTFP